MNGGGGGGTDLVHKLGAIHHLAPPPHTLHEGSPEFYDKVR
jgi:hypothetical protein